MWWDDQLFVQWRYFSRLIDGKDVAYWVFVKDGEVLGACGLEPVTLVIDGKPVAAVRTLDIMVRPDLDGLGLGVFMNLMLFKHFPITLVTGSNEKSHQLLKRMFHHTVDLRFWKAAIRAQGPHAREGQPGPALGSGGATCGSGAGVLALAAPSRSAAGHYDQADLVFRLSRDGPESPL